MGSIRTKIRRGGSRPSYFLLLHLWLLSALIEDGSEIFPKETGLHLVSNELRRFANTHYKEGLRGIDLQYAASGRPTIPKRNFDGVLSRKRPRSGTGIPELGSELAFQQWIQHRRGVLFGHLAQGVPSQLRALPARKNLR